LNNWKYSVNFINIILFLFNIVSNKVLIYLLLFVLFNNNLIKWYTSKMYNRDTSKFIKLSHILLKIIEEIESDFLGREQKWVIFSSISIDYFGLSYNHTMIISFTTFHTISFFTFISVGKVSLSMSRKYIGLYNLKIYFRLSLVQKRNITISINVSFNGFIV